MPLVHRISCRSIRRLTLTLSRSLGTFEHQSRLPRLPIPSLEESAEKYLRSCQPLLSPEEFNRTSDAVQAFVKQGGLGHTLQERLLAYDKTAPNSWLERFWLEKAYLEWREPSLINVNWWCQFKDHPEQPKALLTHPPPKSVISDFQVNRAAGLVAKLLDFKKILDAEEMPPDFARDTPLCMNQYKNQFGTTRMPGETCDVILSQHPCTSTHIILSIRNQLYKIHVVDESGNRASVSELVRLFYAASKNSLETPKEPPVGLLTAGHRDTWYKAYELLKVSPQNDKNIQDIQKAIFVVCLDDFAVKSNLDVSHHQIFHGMNARNRWFDKAIQLVVASNGRAGVNGEHTPADAVIPGKMMDYIVSSEPVTDISSGITITPEPAKLKWKKDEQIEALILEAEQTAIKLIADTESCLLQTDVYGSRFIKEVAKSSPDAYIQMALLMAWQRLHKVPTAVYETASTRAFKHGRTETVRSLTTETWKMAQAFDNDEILLDDKRKLFKNALASQSAYMKDASQGHGVDRHLLGLRCMIQSPEEAKTATLFQDPAYIKSMWFRLSTSNMSPGNNFYGGFGPVVPDGYGINYAIGKDYLKFSISSKRSCAETNSYTFRDTLLRTLKDMTVLFPKRSEIWGHDWKAKHAQEKKEADLFKKMKDLSDQKLAQRDELKESFKKKD